MFKKIYKFSSLVKPIRGYKSSVILDLQRIGWYKIPTSMYNFVTQNEYKNIEACIQMISNKEEREIVKEYYQFLMKNEFIFEINTNEIKLFPQITPNYDVPELITNSVLHLDLESFKDSRYIVSKIEKTGCKHFQLKMDFLVKKDHLLTIETLFFNTSVVSVEIIIKELDENICEKEVITFVTNIGRIKNLFIYKSTKNKIIKSNINLDNIIYLVSEIDFNKEYLGSDNFVVNQFSYSESMKYNLYFNKKLFIDKRGNIKNSNLSTSYGNILKDDLIKIITSNEFQKLWFITKEKIDVCKDCEFRNICVDYRIPLISENGYFFENVEECSYNPYLAKWKGEGGYVPVTEMTNEEIEKIKAEYA